LLQKNKRHQSTNTFRKIKQGLAQLREKLKRRHSVINRVEEKGSRSKVSLPVISLKTNFGEGWG
jgi:hypothetical protein